MRLAFLVVCLALSGCLAPASREVVVFVALDREFSEPVLRQFEKQTGIRVRAKYDVESNKTVGLATELLESRGSGRADLFWNNEILHTLRLDQAQRLAIVEKPMGEDYPAAFRSPTGRWFGFAARARVLIINTDLLPDPAQRPTSLQELVNPRWKKQCGIAKPLFGTTATEAAVAFSQDSRAAEDFYKRVKDNCQIEGGNKQVARRVAQGQYAWGVTDTDDALIEREQGWPVIIIYPDQEQDAAGTLLIPNSLAILEDAPNPQEARQLLEFLLSAEVERQLSQGPSAQIPLHGRNQATLSRVMIPELKVRSVDLERAAAGWKEASRTLGEIFQ